MRARWFAVLVALLLLSLPERASAAASEPSEQTLRRIERYVAERIREGGLPGGAVAVVSDRGVLMVSGAGHTGFRSNHEASPETLYALASVTKTMTATAVLQLYDRSLVDLDAPVTRYVPWFRIGTGPESTQITLRQLLTHTSGIPANAHRVVWQNPKTIRPSLEEGVRALQAIELRHPSGRVFEYSNMNYAVLGLVVERVSGETWGEYLQHHLFGPLGMDHTTTDLSRAVELGLAQADMPAFGRLVPAPFDSGDFYAPSYRVFSSAADMAKYASALLQGTLVDSDTLQEAHQNAVPTGSEWRYGLGWMVKERNGSLLMFHGGDGAQSADLYLLPDQRLAVVLLVGAYSPVLKGQITSGILSLLDGAEPAPFSGRADWYVLLWLSRILTCAGAAAGGSLVWLPFALRRSVRKRNARTRTQLLRWSAVCAMLAVFGWVAVAWVVPLAIPELPFAFGLYGWPADVAVSLGAVLAALTMWAGSDLVVATRLRAQATDASVK